MNVDLLHAHRLALVLGVDEAVPHEGDVVVSVVPNDAGYALGNPLIAAIAVDLSE